MSTRAEPASFVLVHGGYHTAAAWDRLAPYLKAPSIAVDLPGRGSRPADLRTVTLSDFVAAVVEAVDGAPAERVVLVGHSLAGLILPEVARQRPERVEHLVFVSATIPPDGHTQLQNSPRAARLLAAAQGRSGTLRPPPSWMARRVFCNDMDADLAAMTVGALVPEAARVLSEPVRRPHAPAVAATYVRLSRDRAVSPRMQVRQIANYRAPMHEVRLDSGHEVMISRPGALGEVLSGCSIPH